jgi:hypothetical protein
VGGGQDVGGSRPPFTVARGLLHGSPLDRCQPQQDERTQQHPDHQGLGTRVALGVGGDEGVGV